MEFVTAVRRYLLESPVTSLVQGRVWKYRLEEKIDGTGKAALVLSRQSGWAGRDPVNTAEFPRLFVDVHVDPSRGPGGAVRVADGEDRAYAIGRAVTPLFSYPQLLAKRIGGYGSRPGMFVIFSQPYAEPRIVEGGHVGVKDDDVVIIRYEFALAVVDG